MRRTVLILLIIALAVLAAITGLFVSKYQNASRNYANAKSAEESARAQYADAFSAIAEIQDSLNTIALGDTGLAMVSRQLRNEQALTQPNKQKALERISLLSASVRRAKERIRQLEAGLKRSHVHVASLQTMIAGLKQTVSEREQQIAELAGRVDSLQTQVSGLTATVQQNEDSLRAQTQTIEDKRRELATVEYVIGSKKDLTADGLITSKGGVLGIGKTLLLTGHYDDSYFTPMDTDKEDVITIRAPKVENVQVLSAQPRSSYSLEAAGDGTVALRIIDRAAFRTIKHVVIMTKV
jgi:predicted  nucleic acid-binding Zn-ribbon protein